MSAGGSSAMDASPNPANGAAAEYRLRYTEEYLLQAMERYRRTVWWRAQYPAAVWALVSLLGLLLVVAFWSRAFTTAAVLGGCVGGLLGMSLIGNPIDGWIAKRRLRKSPFHNNHLTFVLSESDIHITGTNEEAHLKWSAFSKARR